MEVVVEVVVVVEVIVVVVVTTLSRQNWFASSHRPFTG